MALSTFLKDLEENFFLCPLCLEQFKGPKLLPCLHRYCTKCLANDINRSNDGKIKCPMCEKECALPNGGIDGFKTDFHTKSVVELIQLQKAFEDEHLKKCVSCSRERNVSAYCFKCKDFLCEQCYNFHITNKMFTDHKSRTMELESPERRNITLEKLTRLREKPRCRTHVEKTAKLCCSTCVNEPICTICTYSKHKGHDLHDVTELAKSERELLELKIAELQKLKSKLYELPKKVETTKQKLNENVSKETDKLINQHKEQVKRIKDKLDEGRNEKVQGLADIEKRRKDEEIQTNLNYEEEIKKLNKKYDEIKKAAESKYNNERKLFEDSCEKNEKELVSKLKSLDVTLKNLTKSTDFLKDRHEKEISEISNNCDQVIERYEHFTAIASSILAAKDEWAQVRCIPEIRAACEPLMGEMGKEYPQLYSLPDIVMSGIPNIVVGDVRIRETEQSVVDIDELISDKWLTICGIASSNNGNIVISGVQANVILLNTRQKVSNKYSFITVINKKGETQRHDQIKMEKEDFHPYRFCSFLSEFKVATVCVSDEIGIYDIRDGSYCRRYITDVIDFCSRRDNIDIMFGGSPDPRRVSCVACDPAKNHIIVGTNSEDVYVFDDQLQYIGTVTLPGEIKGVNDISVHAGTSFVCRHDRAYAFSIEGSEGKLIYEFTKPSLDRNDRGQNPHAKESEFQPLSVCTDKNGFIYILWAIYCKLICKIVRYSQDGQHILATRKVDSLANCLASGEVGGSEKLLVAMRFKATCKCMTLK